MTKNSEAVKVDGRSVSLEVCYCVPNVCSDSNTFFEVIGGRNDMTKTQAISAVIEDAKRWAKNQREQDPEISVWDAAGNHY